MQLYNFHTSSASQRVRIALALKQIDYEYVPVALATRDGEQSSVTFVAFNPQKSVPVLVDGDVKITQSLAIIEYIEQRYRSPALLPDDAAERARVRGFVCNIACEMQPMGTLRVGAYLEEAGVDVAEWREHWHVVGLDALEAQLQSSGGDFRYCFSDAPGLADCYLVPHVDLVRRQVPGIDLARWPEVRRVYFAASKHGAFRRARPEAQPDYRQ